MVYILIAVVALAIIVKYKTSRYSFEKQLKKCESPIEEIMMHALFKEGYKPYGQIPCRGYRIDVAIHYKGKKIAIECDGKAFHSTREQIKHDETKDKVLRKEKWIVLRFTGSEINRSAKKCIEEINKYTKKGR